MVKDREGRRLRDRIPSAAAIVACDPGGVLLTSAQFAQWSQEWRERAQDVAFCIGGAHGLSDAVLSAAVLRLSLSKLTFPHELARLVLVEQLYRAGTILRGEPYHK
jgi:23S rRNA (pseudouridine1915-N3)-methyltransferase